MLRSLAWFVLVIGWSVVLLAGACSRNPDARAPSVAEGTKSIGNATMLDDKTLVLDLVATSGPTSGHAQFRYPPSHPEYDKVLQHIGGLQPGQQKLVPPWPDDIDDSRVERSVHAWVARRKGWRRSRYSIEIVGTDAQDNIAVTVFHRADAKASSSGRGQSVALRLAPETYEVVQVLE